MSSASGSPPRASDERATLLKLLAINGAMFVVEGLAGWWGESTGLLADSLDMLADASVYALALWAVGRSRERQADAATASGLLQLALGCGVLLDVVRRFAVGSEPVSALMMAASALALAANVACLALLARHRHGGVHLRASFIFSTSDVIANLGVMVSGALVLASGSPLPDLVVGALIASVVIRGGIRILREAGRARVALTGGEP